MIGRLRISLLAVLMVLGVATAAHAQVKPVDPAAAIASKAISIGGGLKVDIFAPASTAPKGLFKVRKKAPVILWVHGGGWYKGTREKIYNLDRFATERGWILVSMDYRKVPKTNIDGQVADVVRAIRWVRSNILKYGGDSSRIAIMGHSAGSHLVSMVACKRLGGNIRGVVANDVQAYDMVAYAGMRGGLPWVYANAFGNNPSDWVRWSPVTYLRKGQSGGIPPVLIMYSGSDYERRKALANGFAGELRSKGARVSLFDGKRYTHGSIARGVGTSAQVTKAVERFLKRAFR